MSKTPFFSIIIVSFNAEDCIKITIDSILAQKYKDYEIVVKDGLSKDRTLEMIPVDDRVRVFSEEDTDIYDAMNQAIEYSTGKYAIFMNCGDSFYDQSVLEKAALQLKKEADVCLYGNFAREGMIKIQTNIVTRYSLYRSSICHQTVFFPLKLLKEGYLYKTKYSIVADHELELNLFTSAVRYLYLDYPICKYQGGGTSETSDGIKKTKQQKKEIRRIYFSNLERINFGIRYGMTMPHVRKVIKLMLRTKRLQRIYRTLVNKYYMSSR